MRTVGQRDPQDALDVDAVARFLGRLAAGHGLVFFLDDLQWIDPASLELIEALFAGPASSGLLVVGAEYSLETGVVDFFDGVP